MFSRKNDANRRDKKIILSAAAASTKVKEETENSNDGSNFACILGDSVPNSSGRLRRRPSVLFDDNTSSSKKENDDTVDHQENEPSTFSSSLASLTQDSTTTAAWKLRRRKSIDTRNNSSNNKKRPRSSLNSESSHVSATQHSLLLAPSYSALAMSSGSTNNSTSRSLFAPSISTSTQQTAHSVSTIICNTQDVSRFDEVMRNNDNDNDNNDNHSNTNSTNHTLTPKASGRSHAPVKAGRTSLFGSVMQQVGQLSCSKKLVKSTHTSAATATATAATDIHPHSNIHMSSPTKRSADYALDASKMTTPRRVKRKFAFTPEHGKKASVPFGSPGGFQLLDFVNNFGSPFSKHSNMSSASQNNSNLSTKSASEEWQNTALEQGIWDWSLPESLRFDCHPGSVVHSLLQQQHQSASLGMMRFLQPPSMSTIKATPTTSKKNDGLAQWGSGLLFWQHPAVYPSPFGKKPSRESNRNKLEDLARVQQQQQKQQQQQLNNGKKKRRATLDLASSAAMAALEAENLAGNNLFTSLRHQKIQFQRQRREEWQQAFSSLYWKWIAQVRELHENSGNTTLHKTYFYAQGDDHAVLFQAAMDSDEYVLPKILITSSSAAFRDKLRHSGVKSLCLLEAWKGHSKETVFAEEMIQQVQIQEKTQSTSKAKPLKNVNVSSNDNIKTERVDQGPTKVSKQTSSASMESPMKNSATSKLLSPAKASNSPIAEDELAALRRAQVFGETVGADVTISIKPNKVATGPTIALKDVPPLFVTGWDDCAAFFEVYSNLTSSCCVPFKTELEIDGAKGGKQNSKETKHSKSKLTKATNWKVPEDVPLLVCRGVGPFLHATMKSLTVSGNRHCPRPAETESTMDSPQDDYASVEIQGGPILPCAILDCFRGLVQTMEADQQRSPLQSEGQSDEEAMVGSHNLILHAFQPKSTEADDEGRRKRAGITGNSFPRALNHRSVDRRNDDEEDDDILKPESVRSGHTLGMGVWDILHPHAMAYKTDPIPPSRSSLLFPS